MPDELKPGQWYWIRTPGGSLQPYRLYRVHDTGQRRTGEFYVGSMLVTFSLGLVAGEAQGPQPRRGSQTRK